MSFSLAHRDTLLMPVSLHVYTHLCTGHFRGPQISSANAHTHTHAHTLTHAGHFRGPQISGASQTMNETGNKNTESIWSHICFLWRYECLYYSPLADSYILLSTPALLVSLQTSSTAIYLHGHNTILELTPAHHGNTGSKKGHSTGQEKGKRHIKSFSKNAGMIF